LASHIQRHCFHDGLQPACPSRVVDQHIDPVQGACQRIHRTVVSDVRHNCGAADIVGQCLDRALSAGHANDMKALRRKRSRGRFADACTGAGDHCDPFGG
jgi:hypothetical protein